MLAEVRSHGRKLNILPHCQSLANKVKDLTFRVAFNKTVRASKASGASEAGEVSQPVRAKRAGAGGPVQADRTV